MFQHQGRNNVWFRLIISQPVAAVLLSINYCNHRVCSPADAAELMHAVCSLSHSPFISER